MYLTDNEILYYEMEMDISGDHESVCSEMVDVSEVEHNRPELSVSRYVLICNFHFQNSDIEVSIMSIRWVP